MKQCLGVVWVFLCSRFLPEGEAQDPKYWENDCSCGSSGLLGIRKCHKSPERDCLCKIPSPHFRLQRLRCIFFVVMFQKNKQQIGGTSLNQAQSPHLHDLFRMLPNPQFATFLTGSSALLKNVHLLVDKPFNSGNSACLLDFFLESV